MPVTGILQLLERMFLRARGLLGQKFSVRWKLTILYGLMVTLTLGAVGITLWLALQVQTQATIDSDLQSAAGLIANNNGAAQVGPEYTRPKRWDCAYAVPIVQSYCAQVQQKLDNFATQVFAAGHGPGQFEQVQIFDRDGGAPLLAPRLLGQGVSLQNMFASMGANELTSLLTTRVPRYRTLTISENGRHVLTRVLFTPLQLPSTLARRGDSAVIEVFQVESTFIEIKQVTRFVLLLILPLGVLASLIAGWWIARLALRPINRISQRVYAIGVSQDLSQRLEFRGPEDEVSRLAHTFDGMMGRLESLFKAQKRFVADASHELRTPLTAIRGNADLLRIAPPDERDLCIASIRRESERMSRLVNDLLLLAEADLQEQPLHLQQVDLAALMEDIYRAASVLGGDRILVRLEVDDPVEMQVDPDRLKQLLLNLADNAVKFTPDDGVVTLSLRAARNGACIEVTDTGVGIPPEEQDAIFQRFYRVEESRSTRGSGLGLAISASIVKAHGGTIAVSSTIGQGSTFSVWLPNR
ncbi:MAG: hypothetical protein PVSMB7_22430 [Chloroflexota bacterium]